MLFFINDIPFRISKRFDVYTSQGFDITIVDQQVFNESMLKGRILLKSPSTKQVLGLVLFLQRFNNHSIQEIVVLSLEKKQFQQLIKSSFKKIHAGGGLVIKNDKMLMIHRLGLWDLPKGKLDEGETIEECAIREVEEECCIKANLVEKITDTWHSYTTKNGNDMLKKTAWYLMQCTDDSLMKPQIEESIDEIRWMTRAEAQKVLGNSYRSIAYVFQKYDMIKETPQ